MASANSPKSHFLEKGCQDEDDHDIITGITPKQGEHDHIDVSKQTHTLRNQVAKDPQKRDQPSNKGRASMTGERTAHVQMTKIRTIFSHIKVGEATERAECQILRSDASIWITSTKAGWSTRFDDGMPRSGRRQMRGGGGTPKLSRNIVTRSQISIY